MMIKTTTDNEEEDEKSDWELKQHFDQGELRRINCGSNFGNPYAI